MTGPILGSRAAGPHASTPGSHAEGPRASTLILGCGYTGSAVARRVLARGQSVIATVRSEDSAAPLRAELAGPKFTLLVTPALDASMGEHVTPATHVVIAFPPDGATDARIAPALAAARAITYVSSTGVYGGRTGKIDADTPLPDPPSARAERILDAESAYRAVGASILRCPGIYGAKRGLHMRILRGEHRIPGDGSRTLSRIHVEDLASFVLAAGNTRGETFVIGDREPARHIEVVRWVCETYGVPLPPSVPWEEVHETLRADRCVDSSYAIEKLGVELQFPTYREGMKRD